MTERGLPEQAPGEGRSSSPASDRSEPGERRQLVQGSTVAEPLKDPKQRSQIGFSESDQDLMPIVVELNLKHAEGLQGAEMRLRKLYDMVTDDQPDRGRIEVIANTYVRCDLSMDEVRRLMQMDATDTPMRERAVYRVWPDFPIEPLTDRSVSTVKGDAAQRSFAAMGSGINWAVIDSGIDKNHPHFEMYNSLGGDVAQLHRDFTRDYDTSDSAALETSIACALEDGLGHGTHVAGVIGGQMPQSTRSLRIVQHVADEFGTERLEDRPLAEGSKLSGVAPECKLLSLKVFDNEGRGRSTNVIKALQYVREEINGNGKLLRVQGVNLSLGYEFDAKWFACGQSPLCVEVDRLVRSGVVVVVAAGNTGYGVLSALERQSRTGMSLTINDPGNAALAITVGATHRDMPHTYGVSYFSSKGPTGDGRLKPDLVAPGERITSCAAGQALASMLATEEGRRRRKGLPYYVDDSGTSMAAPHVSGAIAAFLSIRREFMGRPDEIKRVFTQSATSLGREQYFQGHGLVDLMRAIQSV